MVAVRIPGAESIDQVAIARDPGVRASPEDFGSQIGEGMQHLGNAAVEVGSLMDRKREAAAAAMAIPEATAKFNLLATQRQQELAKTNPTSAAETGAAYNDGLSQEQEKIIAETRAKYRLNDLDTAKLTGHLTGVRGHAVIGAVTNANNQIVKGLQNTHNDTVNSIASTAQATGDVDGALKQVEQSVAAMRGVVPENDLALIGQKSKRAVVDAVINGYKAAGTKEGFDRAQELTNRFYGEVPATLPAPAKSAMQFFQSKGYTKEQAAGIVGNLAHESNFSTTASGDNGTAFGIAQWRGERLEGLKAYAASKGKPATDFQTQLEYIDQELNSSENGARTRLLAAKTTKDAANAFLAFERPKDWNTANPHGWDNRLRQSQAAAGEVHIPGKAELPDAERALYHHSQIGEARTKVLSAASNDAATKFTRQLIDADAGKGPLPSRHAIETDPYLGEDKRNSLLSDYDKTVGDVVKLQNAMKKFTDPNGGSFNLFDTDEKKNVDRIYNALGGGTQALQTVINRTGIVPEGAAANLRGAMVSPDPKVVEDALQVSANLVGGKYLDVFANVKGGEDLTKTALAFRHYVYDRGFSAAEATKKIMEERTPEYEQKVKARIKSEDVNEIVKKQLKDSDIRHAFDDSWIPFNDPKLTFNPEMRTRAMGDYEEAFRENFAKTGDVSLSKTLALDEMKRTWGTTTVNGQKTVMKYPPERSPVYAGIENAPEQIALQAVSAIKDLNGVDVPRSSIRLDEVKNTAERFVRGEPPVYVLSYVDKNGHVQTIPKQFYADPAMMRDKQTAERAAQSAKIQQRVAIDADMADLSRANFGVQ